MEIRLEVECQFCKRKLYYKVEVGNVEGTIENVILTVEPCSTCTDQAMNTAWKSLKNLHTENAAFGHEAMK